MHPWPGLEPCVGPHYDQNVSNHKSCHIKTYLSGAGRATTGATAATARMNATESLI